MLLAQMAVDIRRRGHGGVSQPLGHGCQWHTGFQSQGSPSVASSSVWCQWWHTSFFGETFPCSRESVGFHWSAVFAREAQVQFDGVVRIPLRFAIDWSRLGPDGLEYSGDSANNADHHAYGADLLAVADGTIEAVTDGVPENVPGQTRAVPITLDTRGGNLVILDIGDGRYATYAHLIPGSLTVRVGDRVKRGDILGKLGNSGNSGGPHLHFHVSEIFDTQNASGLNGSGLPFVFESFEILGEGPHAGARTLEMPIEDAVITLP